MVTLRYKSLTIKPPSKKPKMIAHDHFSLIKLMLNICGISLEEKPKWIYKIYSALILTVNFYPLFQLIGVHRFLYNGNEIFEFAIFEIVTTLILIKAMVLVNKRKLMANLLLKLQSGVFVVNFERGGEKEEKLMKDCVKFTNRQASVYWGIVTITVVFAVIDSAYSRLTSPNYQDWRFEYGKVTMFNTTYSPNYEIASLYQNISWFPIGWTFAISDLLTATVLAHITCHLKILQNSITRITLNSYKFMQGNRKEEVENLDNFEIDASRIPWKYMKPVLQEAVIYHLSIIEIAQQIEETLNLLILLIVLSGIVLIGSLLFQLNGLHFGGVMCIFCEIILISFWGNEVLLESQNVVRACYEVNFYGADVRLQKGLFIMMERSKRPIRFTAGKFSPLTLGTFLWIARASYSYLMILRRLDN